MDSTTTVVIPSSLNNQEHLKCFQRKCFKRNRPRRTKNFHILPLFLRLLHSPENPEVWAHPTCKEDFFLQSCTGNVLRVNWAITVFLAHFRQIDPFFFQNTRAKTPRLFLSKGAFGSVYTKRLRDGRTLAVKSMVLEKNEQARNQHIFRDIVCLKLLQESQYVVSLTGLTWSRCASSRDISIEMWMPRAQKSLRMWLQRDVPNVNIIESVCIQLAMGLEHIHAKDIMHRDIGLSNVLVFTCPGSTSVHVKYCDFGCSTFVRLGGPQRKHTLCICKAPYRAPEIVKGVRLYNELVDVWSLGCVFHELLYGSMLFDIDVERQKQQNDKKDVQQDQQNADNKGVMYSNRYLLDLHWNYEYKCRGRSAVVEHAITRMLRTDPAERICAAHVFDLLRTDVY